MPVAVVSFKQQWVQKGCMATCAVKFPERRVMTLVESVSSKDNGEITQELAVKLEKTNHKDDEPC
jgi:hypothetical protein